MRCFQLLNNQNKIKLTVNSYLVDTKSNCKFEINVL